MKKWMVACLLLKFTAVSTACGNRDINITGADQQSKFRTGWIRICQDNRWKAVCDRGWGIEEARVACKQLNFPEEGAQYCSKSCFGGFRGDSNNGVTLSCDGDETNLADCGLTMATCNSAQLAGVLCYNTTGLDAERTSPPTDCKSFTTPLVTANSQAGVITKTDDPESSHQDNCTVLGITLGGLTSVLLLILLVVITMWVWSCYRHKGRLTPRSDIQSTTFPNPAYNKNSSSAHIPAVQYSSRGPATPTGFSGHSHTGNNEERVYYELEGEGERRDADYEEMEEDEERGGMAYEVPIQTKTQMKD